MGCRCADSSKCHDEPRTGFIISRNDFIIAPLKCSKRSCVCRKREKGTVQKEPEAVDLFNSFAPPHVPEGNTNIFHAVTLTRDPAAAVVYGTKGGQHRQTNVLHMPDLDLQDDTYLYGTTSYQDAAMTCDASGCKQGPLHSLQPLRMPDLNLQDPVYTREINAIARDARFIFEPHTSKLASAGQEVYGNVPNLQSLKEYKNIHKNYTTTPHSTPNIEHLMETIKSFEYLPSKKTGNVSRLTLPNMPNFGGFVERWNQNPKKYEKVVPYEGDEGLRAEIRTLIKNAQDEKKENRMYLILVGLIHILQALMTTAAMVIYYLVWCYTQMMYFIMKSMLFFHNADGSMKLAIGMVTVTSILFAYSLVIKVERIFFR